MPESAREAEVARRARPRCRAARSARRARPARWPRPARSHSAASVVAAGGAQRRVGAQLGEHRARFHRGQLVLVAQQHQLRAVRARLRAASSPAPGRASRPRRRPAASIASGCAASCRKPPGRGRRAAGARWRPRPGSRSRSACGRCAARWRERLASCAPRPCRWARPARCGSRAVCASRQASRLTTVVVLPVPGPPLITSSRRRSASAAASFCQSDARRSLRAGEQRVQLLLSRRRKCLRRRGARRAPAGVRAGARSRSSGAGTADRRRRARGGAAAWRGRDADARALAPRRGVGDGRASRQLSQREADMAVGQRPAHSARAAAPASRGDRGVGAPAPRPALDLLRESLRRAPARRLRLRMQSVLIMPISAPSSSADSRPSIGFGRRDRVHAGGAAVAVHPARPDAAHEQVQHAAEVRVVARSRAAGAAGGARSATRVQQGCRW